MWIDDNVIRLSNTSSDVWNSVLESLRNRDDVPANAVDMYFDGNLEFSGVENGCARLIAKNELIPAWISRFRKPLLSALQDVLPDVSTFKIDVSSKSKASLIPIIPSDALVSEYPQAGKPRVSRAERIRHAENAETLASLYPTYSFETFVEGDSNRMALAICRSIAEKSGEYSMNPLFLFGGPGVGKTHLLQSIGRYAVTYHTASRVVLRTAERFLKDFMQTQTAASREGRSEAQAKLRHTYEDPELLLVDDIQVLAGKGRGATEKALFDVLQKRLVAKKPTVFCADRRPSEIPGLYEGFLRFDSNSVAVNDPDCLTKMEILRKKTEKLQISAEEREKIFNWIVAHEQGNVREIEGVVTKLFAYRDLLGVNLTFEAFRELCEPCQTASSSEKSDRSVLTIAAIKESVAFAYNTSVESLRANSRVKSISLPRKIAMYFCRELTKESLSNIGFHFGRDYSTVIANIKSVEREMRQNPKFAEEVEKLRNSLTA